MGKLAIKGRLLRICGFFFSLSRIYLRDDERRCDPKLQVARFHDDVICRLASAGGAVLAPLGWQGDDAFSLRPRVSLATL